MLKFDKVCLNFRKFGMAFESMQKYEKVSQIMTNTDKLSMTMLKHEKGRKGG